VRGETRRRRRCPCPRTLLTTSNLKYRGRDNVEKERETTCSTGMCMCNTLPRCCCLYSGKERIINIRIVSGNGIALWPTRAFARATGCCRSYPHALRDSLRACKPLGPVPRRKNILRHLFVGFTSRRVDRSLDMLTTVLTALVRRHSRYCGAGPW